MPRGRFPPGFASTRPRPRYRNVRTRASDLQLGRRVLEAGRAIGPAEVAIIAAGSVARVSVHARPKVAILSTGDELRRAGSELGPAGIPDANGPALVALCTAAGADARHVGIAPDRLEPTLRAPAVGARRCGSRHRERRRLGGSVRRRARRVRAGGDRGPVARRDPAGQAVRVRDRAAAAATGRARRCCSSGCRATRSPSSSRSRCSCGPRSAGSPAGARTRCCARWTPAVLEEPVTKSAGRRAFLRVAALRDPATGAPIRDAAGRVRVVLAGGQESHQLSALASADAFAVVPESVAGLPAGLGRRAVVAGPSLSADTEPGSARHGGGMDERSKPRADRRRLTHVDRGGRPRMVDVSAKPATARRAVAEAEVVCSQETLSLVIDGRGPKGDVLTVAEIAGVMGGKRTAELIPLCHPLALTDLVVTITPDRAASALRVRAEAATVGPTGVEMEALVAASVAALTVYDMVKGVEKGVEIRHVRLVSKVGGKSGEWRREARATAARSPPPPSADGRPGAPRFVPGGPPVVRARGVRGPARAGGIRRAPRRPGP